MSSKPPPTAADGRLGDAVRRHRERILDRLCELEWAADPRHPQALVRGAEVVRPRATLFLDALLAGLEEDEWTAFDTFIGRRSIELLEAGVVTVDGLNQRALTLATFLIPFVLAEPDPGPLMASLFGVMQALSGGIVARYNRSLLQDSQRLDDLKTMFLRMTGHELRAPLGNIRGYASLLQAGDLGVLPERAVPAVEAVDKAASGALAMIDRLVEVARLESGSEALHRERHSLSAITRSAIEPLREAIAAAEIDLEVEARQGDAVVDADEIGIALRNLVGNALKYAAAGGVIKIRSRREGDDAVFEVEDRGPGVSPDEVPHLFERYYRSERSRQSGVNGSGLGLYIVRRIAELHGGEASVQTRPGQGATFRLRLPA